MTTPSRAPASPSVVAELSAGLCAPAASIAPKFFYDPLGSRLFEAICELDEYYPTRTEAAIFRDHGAAIAAAAGSAAVLVDLGAGNCAKAARLFPSLRPAYYVPIDISAAFLEEAVRGLRQRFPGIDMLPLGCDFSTRLELPDQVPGARRLFFYPGSSIGNFTPAEALDFLQRVHVACGDDGALLIGVDLLKDHALLQAAYDDALGVTAAFNLNVLRHVNQLLGTDFDVRQWRHVALFNAAAARVEMHLEARAEVTVRWPGGVRQFAAGDRIHTENSYKYSRTGALALLRDAGFDPTGVWTDAQGWFALIHARARPSA